MIPLPPDLGPALAFVFILLVILGTDAGYWEWRRQMDEQTRHETRQRVKDRP